MRRLLYIMFALILAGCTDFKKQKVDDDILEDAFFTEKDTIIEVETIEVDQREYKIFPIDESGSDHSLVDFLTNLKKIVINKDTARLFKSLDSSIVVSYGGGIYGINEFSKEWGLDKPEKSMLWPELNRILKMGGTWEFNEEKFFCMPYTHSDKAFGKLKYEFDWYFTAVCISPKVTVYKEPKTSSSNIAILSYDIVEMDPNYKGSTFRKIQTIDKKNQGYVESSDLDYSANRCLVLKKINNKWKITAFAPYD